VAGLKREGQDLKVTTIYVGGDEGRRFFFV
jgi:hypothetical protein